MTRATREIEWTSPSGTRVKATIIVGRGYEHKQEQVWLDGDTDIVTKTKIIESTEIVMDIGDKHVTGLFDSTTYYHRPQIKAPDHIKDAAMVLSNSDHVVIGITLDNASKIISAISDATDEAEQDAEWADILAKRGEIKAYYEHVARVESAMTLNGHTY